MNESRGPWDRAVSLLGGKSEHCIVEKASDRAGSLTGPSPLEVRSPGS